MPKDVLRADQGGSDRRKRATSGQPLDRSAAAAAATCYGTKARDTRSPIGSGAGRHKQRFLEVLRLYFWVRPSIKDAGSTSCSVAGSKNTSFSPRVSSHEKRKMRETANRKQGLTTPAAPADSLRSGPRMHIQSMQEPPAETTREKLLSRPPRQWGRHPELRLGRPHRGSRQVRRACRRACHRQLQRRPGRIAS